MTRKSTQTQFSVFGTRPENSICLPDIPYSARLNCKEGGLFVGGNEPKHRHTEPEQKVEISIVKASKFFGTLGKTHNVLWIQLFYIAAPSVPVEILPKNTVCVSYIKKQSIGHLYNTVQEALDYGDPGFGIFSLGFDKQLGEKGPYYTISFDWRERQSEEEKQQLELIKTFMSAYGDQLADLEGTREMLCVDGWTTEKVQALIAQHQGLIEPQTQQLRSLPAA